MATKSRKRGSIGKSRGQFILRFWWRDPHDPYSDYRWSVSTHQAATEENRVALEQRLEHINAQIRAGAFFPCQEFPDSKIAAYCQCSSCAALQPLSRSHSGPKTLGELFIHFGKHEHSRSLGEHKIIEPSTWDTKKKGINALSKGFTWVDENGVLCQVASLSDYQIRELAPDSVKEWLSAFQNRRELTEREKSPATTKYLNNLLSIVRQALRYGQLKRWWRAHPLLEYQGALIEKTKAERHRQKNQTLSKPFSAVERDRIIDWFRKQWEQCPLAYYNGKEKVRLLFLYHYVIVGFNTGLRSPSEMTALEWSDIDFSTKRLTVRKSREASGAVKDQLIRDYTKTIKHREVPMNDAVVASFRALEEFRQSDADWVFWNPRAGLKNPLLNERKWAPLTGEKRIRYAFEACLDALQIKSPANQGQYRMRHTFATLALDHTDMSDEKVAAIIGDSVETMRTHYQGHCLNRWRHEDDIEQLNALNRVGRQKLEVVRG
ncbi:site-specific recombinase, phage integrase family [marine gamma proteobacterium HTCC2148]|nr:site-specific recombinase, phage integrase family [marine gamma proteobacterium HTCC2148]